MVELQILSKVLRTKDMSIISLNGITDDYFSVYSEEYNYIKNHLDTYGNIPDLETFQSKFPDVQVLDVKESDSYLVDCFNEEYLYAKAVPVVQKIAELMQTDSNAAVEYLHTQLDNLRIKSAICGTDIVHQARLRYEEWKSKKEDPEKFMISTGFYELDNILGGWQRGEELVVIFARTSNGKTWVLLKTLTHAWKCGYRVGLVEPEMSDTKTGYRFDTLNSNISNSALMRGEDVNDYESYIENLNKHDAPFFVVHPKEFNRHVTVSKLRTFVLNNNIDILAIDGISYMEDERRQRGDNRTTQITNIAEDLMDLSIELKIPILVVSQSNREGVKEDDSPSLENIRDSDGLAFNSSVALSVRQKDSRLEMCIRKNRNGLNGNKLIYLWDIDTGNFSYVENSDSPQPSQDYEYSDDEGYGDGSEVF